MPGHTSLNSYHRFIVARLFLVSYEGCDHYPYKVIGFALTVRNLERLPQTRGFECLCYILSIGNQAFYCRTTRDLNSLYLVENPMLLLCQILFSLLIAAVAVEILMWISAIFGKGGSQELKG